MSEKKCVVCGKRLNADEGIKDAATGDCFHVECLHPVNPIGWDVMTEAEKLDHVRKNIEQGTEQLIKPPQPAATKGVELLPCPFCGSTHINIEWEPCEKMVESDTTRRWFAECTACACQGPFCQRETEVKAAWNTRTL